MNPKPTYHSIVKHYESCLEQFGDTHRGVDWPKPEDAETRYRVMLDLLRFDPFPLAGRKRLLDFGCGAAHLFDYLQKIKLDDLMYAGLDISPKFIELCRAKFPGTPFYCADLLEDQHGLPQTDYMIMNGVFTEKRELSFAQMFEYFSAMLVHAFPLVKRGLAFNVMSKAVDWEREDLFHLPLDQLQHFLVKQLGRHFIIRNDYGLYEYTVYVYHAG